MLHNYKWQGRVLEVREDRGFIEPAQRHHHLSFHPPAPPTFPTNGQQHPNTLLLNGSTPIRGPPEVSIFYHNMELVIDQMFRWLEEDSYS